MRIPGLVALGLMASGARAELIVFDNGAGVFTWQPQITGTSTLPGNFFDPSLPPEQQGAATPSSLFYRHYKPFSSSSLWPEEILTVGTVRMARDVEPVYVQGPGGIQWPFWVATTFTPGQHVGGANEWSPSVDVGWYNTILGQSNLLGQHPITGVRLELATGTHYGWVEWDWRPYPLVGISLYQPVRWAYESTPGAAALVPAPGVVIIALVHAAWFRRSRVAAAILR